MTTSFYIYLEQEHSNSERRIIAVIFHFLNYAVKHNAIVYQSIIIYIETCGNAPLLENGHVEQKGRLFGSIAEYSCNTAYQWNDKSIEVKMSKCTNIGWEKLSNSCVGMCYNYYLEK